MAMPSSVQKTRTALVAAVGCRSVAAIWRSIRFELEAGGEAAANTHVVCPFWTFWTASFYEHHFHFQDFSKSKAKFSAAVARCGRLVCLP